MDFIYLTDTHFRATKPQARTDSDYVENCIKDFEEVLIYATKNSITHILHAGDFFNKGYISKDSSGSVALFTKLCKMLNRYNITVITTLGQHDTDNRNQASYLENYLGLMEFMGLVEVLLDGDYRKLDNVNVLGFGYDCEKLPDALNGTLPDLHKSKNATIALFHASCGWKHQGLDYAVEDLDPKFDMCLFGDIHDFEGEHKFASGGIALAAGSFCQMSVKDIDRVPSFYHIKVSESGKLSYELHKLKPIEDRFSHDNVLKKENSNIDALEAAILRAQEVKSESQEERVHRLGKELNFTKTQIDLVVNNL